MSMVEHTWELPLLAPDFASPPLILVLCPCNNLNVVAGQETEIAF